MKKKIIYICCSILFFANLFAQNQENNIPNNKNKLTKKNINVFLDKLIDIQVDKDEFSGSILVAKEGEIIYKRAVGEAWELMHTWACL